MGESINQPRPRDQQCYGTQQNNHYYPWSKRARAVFSCYLKLIIWASTFVYLQRTKKYYWKRKTLVVGTIQRKFRRSIMTSKAVQHQRSRITQCSLRKVNPVTYSRNWKKKISTLSSCLPLKASATWWDLHFTQNQSPVIRYTQKQLDEIFHDFYSLLLWINLKSIDYQ